MVPDAFAVTDLCQRMDLVAEAGLSMAEVDRLSPEALVTWITWLEVRRVRRVRDMAEAFTLAQVGRGGGGRRT